MIQFTTIVIRHLLKRSFLCKRSFGYEHVINDNSCEIEMSNQPWLKVQSSDPGSQREQGDYHACKCSKETKG